MSLKSGKSDEEISSPSGRYKTISVDVETSVNGVKIKSKSWHAPDVGIVKQVTELGDKKITRWSLSNSRLENKGLRSGVRFVHGATIAFI